SGASLRARPGHPRTRGVRLRAARDDGRPRAERPRGRRSAALHPHRAIRSLTRKEFSMRKTITSLLAATVIAVPVANATAAVKAVKKTVVRTKRFTGSTIDTGRYGLLRVTIVVRKTTSIVGTRKSVKRRITSVSVPVYPNDTDRSAFISQNA